MIRLNFRELQSRPRITLTIKGLHGYKQTTVNSKRLLGPRITQIKRILAVHDIAITLIVKGFHRCNPQTTVNVFFDHGLHRLNGLWLRTNITITLIVKGFHRCTPKKQNNSRRLFRPRITLIKRILAAHDITITLIVKGFHRLLATDEDRLNRYKPKTVNG